MITLIAAVADNGVIGNGNAIPWHVPEDLKRFKRLTTGHPVIMGRKTFESIIDAIGKPLPGRTSVVLTRDMRYRGHLTSYENVMGAMDLESAIGWARLQSPHVFIAGGASVYEATWQIIDRAEITWVRASPEGDTYFPHDAFQSLEHEHGFRRLRSQLRYGDRGITDDDGNLVAEFCTYERTPDGF